MTLLYHSHCEQCGASLAGRKAGVKFCTQACARSRHNTKMLRGAALHDLLLTWRKSYKNRHLITDIGRVVKEWVEEEEAREAALKQSRNV